MTPPPTPPREKTPSVETEIAETELEKMPSTKDDKEEVNTFYAEPVVKVDQVYNLTNKDYIDQRLEALKGMIRVDEKEK